MFAETEINLVNGLAALALGFGLLVLVAWVDRRYLQKYEEVQSAEEERKNKAEKPFIDEAVTEESEIPTGATESVPSGAVTVVSSRTADAIAWKDKPGSPAEPLPTMLPDRKPSQPKAEPATAPAASAPVAPTAGAAKQAATEPHKRQPKKPSSEKSEPLSIATEPAPDADVPAAERVDEKVVVANAADENAAMAPATEREPAPTAAPTEKRKATKRAKAARSAKPEPSAEAESADSAVIPITPITPVTRIAPAAPPASEKSVEKPVEKPAVDAPTADPEWDQLPTVARERTPKFKPVATPATAEPKPVAAPVAAPVEPRAVEPVLETVAATPVPDREPEPRRGPPVLPKGAEAALASILEVVPDPRNTIALTRDPTAEVRLTKADRNAAERTSAITSSGQPRGDYEPPAPSQEEWDTPKEPAASDRLAATPDHAHR